MNIKNLLTLTIRTSDFNLVARQPDLLAKLRKLTLNSSSGLNHELNELLKVVTTRSVNTRVILAYRFRTLVGWGLLSKETTTFKFPHSYAGYKSEDGIMFQVFVDPIYRRQGIASELYKRAQSLIESEVLCICPWDNRSLGFYNNFPNVKTKWL